MVAAGKAKMRRTLCVPKALYMATWLGSGAATLLFHGEMRKRSPRYIDVPALWSALAQ